jgi:hypothetical protein
MKVFVILKIARQYEGEFVLVQILKVFDSKEKAEQFTRSHEFKRGETIDGIECVIEIGVIEAEIE